MDINLHSIISTLGLTGSEAEIFEHLLEYGEIKAVELRKNLRLDRAPFYRALSLLEDKNLILVQGSLRKQLVSLQNISSITSILTKKRLELDSAEKSLLSFQANMKELRDKRYHRDNVEIFSGEKAFENSMFSVLKGGGKIFRDITPDSETIYQMAGGQVKYMNFFREFKPARVRQQVKIQILFDNHAKHIDEISMTNPKDLKESRKYDGNLKLDCYLNTCGSRSLFYTKDQSGYWGIVLKDPLITNLLNSLFDVIWNLSKPL